MTISRIVEDVVTSRSHRYTLEDTEISASLVMEVANGEPAMYMTVSFPVSSTLTREDLLQDKVLRVDPDMNVYDGHAVYFIHFVEPALAANTDDRVFNATLHFVLNRLYHLSGLDRVRKNRDFCNETITP